MIYPIDEFLSYYKELKQKFHRREITRQAFVKQAGKLQARDPSGTYWSVDPELDQFYRYTGHQWVADNSIFKWQGSSGNQGASPSQPPQSSAASESKHSPQPAAVPQPDRPAQKPELIDLEQQQKPTSKPGIFKAAPILALLPSVVCGGLWLLYTFIGVFKNEGLGGVDCCTPAIIVIVPALFWLFGKQIDRLLSPLQPIFGAIPKALRYGIILGVPFLFGCGCSLLSRSGYLMLQLSTLFSVLVAGLLMRVPEVKK